MTQLSSEPDRPNHSPRRAIFVHAVIVLATALFLAVVGLLYWQSLHHQAATALLIIEADARLDGATVTVEPVTGRPQSKPIDPAADYTTRFILAPGLYTVTVEHKGRTVARTAPTQIGEFQIGRLILKSQPATAPAGRQPL